MTSKYKINHDSLWVKITKGKNWAKIHIGRNGETFTATNQLMLDKIMAAYEATSGSYGERIATVYKQFE